MKENFEMPCLGIAFPCDLMLNIDVRTKDNLNIVVILKSHTFEAYVEV